VKTSFARQLERLAAYFNQAGVRAVAAGGGPDGGWSHNEPSAAILLGYPDQFSSLLGEGGSGEDLPRLHPVFLWAQLSRPAPSVFGRAVPVPLTAATARFLAASGHQEVCDPIPHCVDTSLFRPRSQKEREAIRCGAGLGGKFVVGTVAAFTKRKRLDRILDAFALFSRTRGNARLVIKTDRVRSLEGDDLERMAGERGISDSATFITGDAGDDEMARLYSLMDVYINLSEWEGFCIPVIEAMASGVPVIAQPGQGPGETVPYRELLVEGSGLVDDGGTLLSYARPETAAARLTETAESPGVMKALAERGRVEAEARYDLAVVGEKWLSLIDKTTGRAGNGR
jgi:glycosyltransferase involved in cell wall biosynthesis